MKKLAFNRKNKKSTQNVINVKKIKHYVAEWYILEKTFTHRTSYIDYHNVVRYEMGETIHEGSYIKQWSDIYKDKDKLVKELKDAYKKRKESAIYFYSSLKHAMKEKDFRRDILVIREVGRSDDNTFCLQLKKKKKKNPASHNHKGGKGYYCDCWHCTKTTYEKRRLIDLEDEVKINQ